MQKVFKIGTVVRCRWIQLGYFCKIVSYNPRLKNYVVCFKGRNLETIHNWFLDEIKSTTIRCIAENWLK